MFTFVEFEHCCDNQGRGEVRSGGHEGELGEVALWDAAKNEALL